MGKRERGKKRSEEIGIAGGRKGVEGEGEGEREGEGKDRKIGV